MEIGIIGQKQSGKSTLFQIMTGVNSREIYGEKCVQGIAKVPDERFQKLVEIFKPAKISPATVPFVDVSATGADAWSEIRENLMHADGLLHIVDGFTTSSVGQIVKNYRGIADELVLSDLMIVERRIERLAKLPQKSLGAAEILQAKILPGIKEALEEGKSLRDLTLSADEESSLKNFSFWTIRPELVVLNVAEGSIDVAAEFQKAAGLLAPAISICCQIEAEIASLPPADRGEFLKSMGIETPAFEKVIQTAFSLLKRISYFTVGEDEVKAWVILAGSTAPRAAAAIHRDFEKSFIRAEVVSFDDFMKYGGTLVSAKSSGKLRLEGKEYIVKDGDIISFRLNA